MIRISGPEAGAILERMTGRRKWIPRLAALTALRRGETVLDRGLVTFFPGPGSYTGEDLAMCSANEQIEGRLGKEGCSGVES